MTHIPTRWIRPGKIMEQPMDIGNIMGNVSNWLVVWNKNFIFSIQLGMSSSQLLLTHSIIFQRGWLKPPTNQEWGYVMGI